MANVNSPLGYGLSLSVNGDISVNARSSSGVERVIEAIAGRLFDVLWYNSEYGVGNLINRLRVTHPNNYGLLAAECQAEIEKDDRIDEVEVSITLSDNTRVDVIVSGVAITGESFEFTKKIDNVTAEDIASS